MCIGAIEILFQKIKTINLKLKKGSSNAGAEFIQETDTFRTML